MGFEECRSLGQKLKWWLRDKSKRCCRMNGTEKLRADIFFKIILGLMDKLERGLWMKPCPCSSPPQIASSLWQWQTRTWVTRSHWPFHTHRRGLNGEACAIPLQPGGCRVLPGIWDLFQLNWNWVSEGTIQLNYSVSCVPKTQCCFLWSYTISPPSWFGYFQLPIYSGHLAA